MRTPKHLTRVLVAVVLLAGLVALVPAVRHAVLRAAGGVLVISDPVDAADVGVITESGEGDEIELADLFQRRVFPRVLILAPSPTAVDVELRRRGAHHEDFFVLTLTQLGVPASAIQVIDAGEGGTNESALALAAWTRQHPSRVLVVIDPTHARRYRRTLLRAWPAGAEPPRVTWSRHALFRPEDWWRSRRTLREGLFELEKLAWDYASHPF